MTQHKKHVQTLGDHWIVKQHHLNTWVKENQTGLSTPSRPYPSSKDGPLLQFFFFFFCISVIVTKLLSLIIGCSSSFLPLVPWKIERKAMIRNRYKYPTPPIRDIKWKETQTQNNWTLMKTSLAESQTDSFFPTKWPNGYPKQKRCKRHTHSKINHDRRTALEWSVKSISLGA